MTYSERSLLALAMSASSSLSKTAWVMPPRSRMSMKRSPPRSRTRCTQPSSTTSAPTSSGRSAPQVWVRVRSPSCSATSLQYLENRGPRRGLIVSVLGVAGEVLDGDRAGGDFVATQDGDEGNPAGISVLDLLADLVRIWIDEGAETSLT